VLPSGEHGCSTVRARFYNNPAVRAIFKAIYSYKVLQGRSVIASGDDGVDIVRDGKITFDGLEATLPK